MGATALPRLPAAAANGTVDALTYSHASIARDIIRDRRKLGLSQAELARKAGIRAETLNRIEKRKTAPTTRILERIDRALVRAEADAVKS
jgi:predicted transcriptional regulator